MPEGLMSRANAMPQGQGMPMDPAMAQGQGMPMDPAMAQGQGQGQGQGMSMDDMEESVSPEQQEAYESAMQMVGQLLYVNDQVNAKLMQMVKPENPATGIADASAFLLSKIEEAFEGEYPEDLVVNTADEISDLVMELVDAAGNVEVTEDIAIEAKGLLTQQIIEAYGVDESDFEAATQDVSEEDVEQYAQMFGRT